MTPTQTLESQGRNGPLALLAAAILWAGLVRAPLILNAGVHLDSDLAVDGLTLAEAVRGHWRWHYPGTPHMGTPPVLLSWIPAKLAGANPVTLVTGGLVAEELLIVSVFFLTWRVAGRSAATWGLVGSAFASTGTVWLSGRITGGHLLTAAWHGFAFLFLYAYLSKGTNRRAVGLGLFLGLGLYLDRMFLFSAAVVLPASLARDLFGEGRLRIRAVVLIGAFVAGLAPIELGRRSEPYDAYHEQFEISQDAESLTDHAHRLVMECLPRLASGHLLPDLKSIPRPSAFPTSGGAPGPIAPEVVAPAVTCLSLGLWVASFVALARKSRDPAAGTVKLGLLFSSAAIAMAFILNKNIFNSDNYRYLVFVLVPFGVGFGALLDRMASTGRRGRASAVVLASAFALLMAADLANWYKGFGWIDERFLPVRRRLDDPILAWLDARPEVASIYGGYWDVYRLSFLTGGRVRGVPFPFFPDRFPEWKRALPKERPEIVIIRPTRDGATILRRAIQGGARELERGREYSLYEWK